MNLFEFQAKELLARHGIEIPRGRVATTPAEAAAIARRLGFARYAIKAQVHAGDRLAAGGVSFTDRTDEVTALAAGLLGRPLATSQTAPRGQLVRCVLIEEAIEVERLIYAAVTVDAVSGRLVLLVSAAGGDEVERTIARDPARMTRLEVSLSAPRADDLMARAAAGLDLPAPVRPRVEAALAAMLDACLKLDARLVEINPLAVTPQGRVVALDAKVTIDENALFRHPDLASLREVEAAETGDPVALGADRHNINYLLMDGDIGVAVNGAGLALATLDCLGACGGRPANFMDIRTTASSLDIAYGFRLIAANPATRAILVNVHGGGMQRCDTIAEGMAVALREAPRRLPIVVRLAGNNAEFARTRLAGSGVAFVEAADMQEAAERAVRLAAGEVG